MKLLLTGAFNYSDENLKALSDLGMDITFLQFEKDEVINPQAYDAVVCNGLFLHNDIKKFTNLKHIQLTSAGFDRIDVKYCEEKGIKLFNARGVYSVPIAEWAILKILELYKKSRKFYENEKNHNWEKEREIFELFEKTAVIVGCGSIGTEIAKRLKVFGVEIVGVDIFKPNEIYDEYFDIKDINESLKKADIVISTVPLTEDTIELFSEEKFSLMKETAVFCNFSRGKVVNENDLIDALKNKEIYGAVLDVFETEPLDIKSPLWDMENAIVTPHNSFVGEGNQKRMFDVILKNFINSKEV